MYNPDDLLYNSPIANRIGGTMYRLNKFPNYQYQVTKYESGRFKPIFQGTESQTKYFMEYEGFDEIESSFQEMFKNDHNCAEFGVMKKFFYTFNNKNLYKLFQ